MQRVPIGILQQFRGGAFAGTGWWYVLRRLCEEFAQILLLAPCIQHPETGEKLHLQLGRQAVPFASHRLDLGLEFRITLFGLLDIFAQPLLEPLQVGPFALALENKRRRILPRSATGITPGL